MRRLREIVGSVSFYPVTLTYLAATVLAAAVANKVIQLAIGLILLSLFTFIVILLSMHREVNKVHTLVNSQHDALVGKLKEMSQRNDELAETVSAMALRIEELLDTLRAAGVPIPQDKAGVDRE